MGENVEANIAEKKVRMVCYCLISGSSVAVVFVVWLL